MRGVVKACQEVGVAAGGREGSDNVNVNVGEGLVWHKNVLDGRPVMAVDFAELAWVALPCPCYDVPAHTIPHETLTNQMLRGMDSGVGEAVERGEDSVPELQGGPPSTAANQRHRTEEGEGSPGHWRCLRAVGKVKQR